MGGAVARRGKHSDAAVPPLALRNIFLALFLSGILELGKNSSFFSVASMVFRKRFRNLQKSDIIRGELGEMRILLLSCTHDFGDPGEKMGAAQSKSS